MRECYLLLARCCQAHRHDIQVDRREDDASHGELLRDSVEEIVRSWQRHAAPRNPDDWPGPGEPRGHEEREPASLTISITQAMS